MTVLHLRHVLRGIGQNSPGAIFRPKRVRGFSPTRRSCKPLAYRAAAAIRPGTAKIAPSITLALCMR